MTASEAPGPQLVALCRVDLELGPVTRVGDGPSGTRVIAEVRAMTLTGDRINGTLTGRTSADWLTIVGGVATIDVRAMIKTDDGATIYVQYRGRTDATHGFGAAPIYVTPMFETGDERYRWLNNVVAVGKGRLEDRRYDWYEVR